MYAKLPRIDKKSARKNPLNSRAIEATWVGIHDATIENIVIGEDGKAIRVRTILRKIEAERWNKEIEPNINAIPFKFDIESDVIKVLVLKEDENEDDDAEEMDMSIHGEVMIQIESIKKDMMRRRLKNTRSIQEEFGYTNDCKGCESAAAGSYH